MARRLIATRRTVLGAMLAGLAPFRPGAALSAPSVPPLITTDYAQARTQFRTQLTRRGPAPDEGDPLTAPPGAVRLAYRSGALELAAWVSEEATRPGKRPALLFLHGGNALSTDHWDLTLPYRLSGYVAMVPALRGENGLPGAFSAFYNETDDVLAAADLFAGLPGVDRDRLFLAGHSIGATQALLAAMSSRLFRGATTFSGNPDAAAFFRRFPEEVCFDTHDVRELQMRSALCFATSFKCPVRILHGSEETRLAEPSRLTAERARAAGLDVQAAAVPGDHFTALRDEIRGSITFFGLL
ncbi:alpha/beta hydrolase family protein [Labrys wisconsinensis]|uniref:Dipeptidyl aminopeptidase/acylaminoacyl peptidase n=1 Tax=Labrys wisconsinensis TaxID=425677 RepID=A0ABU0JH79_9HYPH|nr:prolyl oligopeptidase family serine peptidase [Labrys wisconsinensis]MDQ0473649.1 dipeptidyl aminopeptidase/acylaminoacyl peptidase [Labrys wisconsinensis]